MPAFAFAQSTEALSGVTQISDYWSCYGIDYLAPQQQIAGQRVLEMDDVL